MNLSSSTTGSSSCQCTTTLCGEIQQTQKSVFRILIQLRSMLTDSLAVVGLSWDLDQKRIGTEPILTNQMEIGTELQKCWCSNTESGHPFFRALSVYGATAGLCNELSEDSESSGKANANAYLETMEIPTELPIADPHTDVQPQGNLVQYYERRFEQLSDDQKLSKLCSDAGLRIVEKGLYFFTLDTEEGDRMQHINASIRKEDSSERTDSEDFDNRSSLGHKSLSP